MLIAREKKKTNIAEYILYMWQVEAMLRALNLDIRQVDEKLIGSYRIDEATAKEMHEWYENLIEMMRLEKVEKSGHIQVLKNDAFFPFARNPGYALPTDCCAGSSKFGGIPGKVGRR